ncbi:hypothetical protein [Pontibacter liquoris]|uniref:hypothetical protein n=1 Tax=Pontibacter liquoris TaxID=2905677 RepID=UPI001FA7BA3C|nr:hypothetical protein [Pontibacter liquoris]
MKTTAHILKTGVAVAFAAVVGFGCNGGERPESNPTDDTSTSEAIVDETDAEHLNEPRPAAIGDTSVTGEQADQFGNEMKSNQDSANRAMHELDEQKAKENSQQPKPKQ